MAAFEDDSHQPDYCAANNDCGMNCTELERRITQLTEALRGLVEASDKVLTGDCAPGYAEYVLGSAAKKAQEALDATR